jgi:arylsulfatase A
MKLNKTLHFSVFISISAAFSFCDSAQNDEQPARPNILILLADDMGYRDIGPYGGISHTPNLDHLAGKGIIFSDFYAAAPNCSPSRAALLTGRIPARTGMYSYRPPDHPMHLQAGEITIAEILREQGYHTSLFGKWHLGSLSKSPEFNHPQPDELGFDYFFATEHNAEPSHINPENFIRNGEPVGQLSGSSAQILADEVISWFNSNKKPPEPFFMYVAFHEPHASTQWASPPGMVEKYSKYSGPDANYLANVENLDSAAGRILNYLVEKELLENTIIIFSSDNGSYRQASNGELKAVKSYLYEGGIRVPAIIHWPLLNNQSRVINEPAGLIDILPTLCEILQISPLSDRKIDGTSILDLLKGADFDRKNPLSWFFYRTSPEIAVRINDFMIMGRDDDKIPRTHHFTNQDMTYIRNMTLLEYELYDLNGDISQSENIIDNVHRAEYYKQIINDKLEEIQTQGYKWENLPPQEGPVRIKTEWVKY